MTHLDGSHVIQERVLAPERMVLVPEGGEVVRKPLHFQLGEYMFDGQLAGFLAFVAPDLVISYISDERAVPCFVLDATAPGASDDDER
ncbi:MAG: hypothetical protein AB1486_26845 [Planctomycetota bacterium]